MYQRVKEYIRRFHMLDGEDRVIAGVSGGADSICLLFMLTELSREMGFTVAAVHVHHGLRGASADRDAAYVEEVCREWGVKCLVSHEDVGRYARQNGLTTEEAGRDVRRAVLKKVKQEEGGTKIALAHHMDDNAETMLFHMARGTGLGGMIGIRPAAGRYIRPLMTVRKGEIEEYLKAEGISSRVDATNREDIYARKPGPL